MQHKSHRNSNSTLPSVNFLGWRIPTGQTKKISTSIEVRHGEDTQGHSTQNGHLFLYLSLTTCMRLDACSSDSHSSEKIRQSRSARRFMVQGYSLAKPILGPMLCVKASHLTQTLQSSPSPLHLLQIYTSP